MKKRTALFIVLSLGLGLGCGRKQEPSQPSETVTPPPSLPASPIKDPANPPPQTPQNLPKDTCGEYFFVNSEKIVRHVEWTNKRLKYGHILFTFSSSRPFRLEKVALEVAGDLTTDFLNAGGYIKSGVMNPTEFEKAEFLSEDRRDGEKLRHVYLQRFAGKNFVLMNFLRVPQEKFLEGRDYHIMEFTFVRNECPNKRVTLRKFWSPAD